MSQTIAMTRAVSPTIADCELSFVQRQAIDFDRADQQHRSYEMALAACGCRVYRLPPAVDQPDAVFVEDTALVLDEIAVMMRPGAATRRTETTSVADTLHTWRPLSWITAPATLDGGDVLRVGNTLYVGRSARSNDEGRRQLDEIVRPFGYRVVSVTFVGCLHLKSAVTLVTPDTLLIDTLRIEPTQFEGMRLVQVPPEEHAAANALAIGGRVLVAAGFPGTYERLDSLGFETVSVENDELAKAEGGLTCCSLIFES